MEERVNLIRKLFNSNNNNAESKKYKIRKKQRNKVQLKRRNINSKIQVHKAFQPNKSTKLNKAFHVTKKRLTKPISENFLSRDIFKEPLHQASEEFCEKELKYIHNRRQPSEDYKPFMEVSPLRSAAIGKANSNWNSHAGSSSYVPSIKIVEVSKSDSDDDADNYNKFNPKVTSTVQQENLGIRANVPEEDDKGYSDFASRATKGILEEVGNYFTIGYYNDTKAFLQAVYKETSRRKPFRESPERRNMESVDIQRNKMKAEKLRSLSVSPPMARASEMPLNSHRSANVSHIFTTPYLSPTPIDITSSPEVYHTPVSSPSTPLLVSPIDTVTLNADEVLKKCTSKDSLDFVGDQQEGCLNTTELRCSYSKVHNYTSRLPSTVLDPERFHFNNTMHQFYVSEYDSFNTKKLKRIPEDHHDLSLMACNDMSLSLQIPVKYRNEDAIGWRCSHCRGRGIQMIPVNPPQTSLALKHCLKSCTPDIKYFPRKTYREDA